MTLDQFNTALIFIGFGTLYYLVKNTLPAYFTEKGKNLATKEDIGEITEKVEKVKEEFTSKAEQLRIDLQYYNQLRFSVKTEERNSIVNCHEKYCLWLTYLINSQPAATLDEEGVNAITKKNNELEDAYLQVQIAEAKMQLYLYDKKTYIRSFLELKKSTLLLHNYTRHQLALYHKTIKTYILQEAAEQSPDVSVRLKLLNDSHEEVMGLMKEHRDEMFKQYEGILKMSDDWQSDSLNLLTNLSSQVVMV